ncbi:polysaccharide deacetylase family protein [Candidatus Uabimicrobium amorphum]|uniref:Polysaccharide deacetylase n=1 Tax=Uabimicrobium amorphum TaxID=2596890 RepID=A0A5S9IR55_UABAM|nr:polysaccharide deacetylase family protein [Candidatus Uabimicrobium amorphum]BBM85165.1 polysaccharide deacetylase [Candidatus Uabimicrobium amorphum]
MKRFHLFSLLLIVVAAAINNTTYYFLIFILWFIILNIGVFYLRSRVFIDGIPRKRIPGKIVLTIDDGPHPNLTPDLLQLLGKYHFQATFFVIGRDASEYPHLIKEICDRGHTIAHHSYRHVPWLNFMLRRGWEQEFTKTHRACEPYIKKKWFRPPYALMSPHLAKVLQSGGYELILFDIRALDFGNRRTENLAKRLLKTVDKGGVVLFHGKMPENYTEFSKKQLLEELDIFFNALQNKSDVVSLDHYLELTNGP